MPPSLVSLFLYFSCRQPLSLSLSLFCCQFLRPTSSLQESPPLPPPPIQDKPQQRQRRDKRNKNKNKTRAKTKISTRQEPDKGKEKMRGKQEEGREACTDRRIDRKIDKYQNKPMHKDIAQLVLSYFGVSYHVLPCFCVVCCVTLSCLVFLSLYLFVFSCLVLSYWICKHTTMFEPMNTLCLSFRKFKPFSHPVCMSVCLSFCLSVFGVSLSVFCCLFSYTKTPVSKKFVLPCLDNLTRTLTQKRL
jgi:hypothetical protein